jgi:hypothetical protein
MSNKWGSSLVLASMLAACTPGPTTAPVTEPKVTNTTTVGGGGDGPAADFTPVATPKSVLVVVRALRPKETLAAAQKLGKMPQSLETLLEKETKGASSYVDFSEPADFVIALDPATRDFSDPTVFTGFSVPLKKPFEGLLDLIEKEGDEVRRDNAGLYRIRSKKMACEIAVPSDRAPRIVCADSTAAFKEIGPFMTRTLPTQPKPAADLSVLVDFAGVNERLLPLMRAEFDKRLGDVRSGIQSLGITDPELLDAPAGAARELTAFVEELGKAELTVAIDPDKKVGSVKGEIFFRDGKSWATRVLTKKNSLVTPPPDAFWRMPKDADTAMFGHAADPIEFATTRRILKKAVMAGLGFTTLADGDKAAIGTLVDSIPSTLGGTYAYATGPVEPLKGGISKPDSLTPDQALVEAKNRLRGLIGWVLVSGEGDVAQMSAFFKNAADSYARVIKHYRAEAQKKNRKSDLDDAPKVTFVANPPGLPKGSAALDMSIDIKSENVWNEVHPVRDWDQRKPHPKGAGKKGKLELRFVAVPSEGGGFVWGIGTDTNVLKEKLLATQKSAKPEGQLGSRSDLARLKKPANGGGFMRPGHIVRGFAQVDKNDRDSRDVLQLLDGLPHKGEGLMFFSQGGAAGKAPSVSFETQIEQDWVEDLGAVMLLLMR